MRLIFLNLFRGVALVRKGGAIFITGFPGFSAKRLIKYLVEKGEDCIFLVQGKFVPLAEEFIRTCKENNPPGTLEMLVGDVLHLDLGLSGKEIKRLSKEVAIIHHTAAIYYHNVPYSLAEAVNVDGTKHLLDLATDLDNLKRVVFYSTAFVSGDRTGVIMEEDLDEGQSFRNAYEKTKFLAENLVRNRFKDIPISVVRPSIIVGDSKTGEIERMDGPYYLIKTIVTFPVDVHLPLPGGGTYPLNMVPIDFVVGSADVISKDPRAVGKTFHITDPNPLSARKVFEIVADVVGRKRPKGFIPPFIYHYAFKIPFIEKVFRAQRVFIEIFNQLVIYNCMNTLEILDGTGVQCPPFPRYAGALVGFVQRQMESLTADKGKVLDDSVEEDPFY